MSADPDPQPVPRAQDDPALWPLLRVLAAIAARAARQEQVAQEQAEGGHAAGGQDGR
jgi:hypothetical protein